MDLPHYIVDWAEQIPQAVIATRADGSVILWNDAAARLYLWSRAEALGRNIMTLTPSLQSKDEARQVMQRLRTGASWQGAIVLRRRDGLPFTAFVADIPVEDGGDFFILGISAPAKARAAVLAAEAHVLSLLRAKKPA